MWFKYTHCAKNSPRFLFLRLSLVWLFAICITMYGKIEINKWHVYLIIYPRKNIKELNLTGLLTHGQTSISICSDLSFQFLNAKRVFHDKQSLLWTTKETNQVWTLESMSVTPFPVTQSHHFRLLRCSTSGLPVAPLPVKLLTK